MAKSSRQVKADETRRRLFAAGTELLVEQGYVATTAKQIARRAGVAKGTFFFHYKSKDALVTAMVELQLRIIGRERERLVAEGASPLERLRATVMALGRLAERNVVRAVLTAGMENPETGGAIDLLYQQLLAMMTDDVRDAVRAREVSRSTAPETFALLVMDSYLGAAVSYAANPRGRSLEEMLATLFDAYVSAFAPRKKLPKRGEDVRRTVFAAWTQRQPRSRVK
ncbi:MAG TPA: TetR/AcrR family transcriptional regulator [Polyangiaceae bacterium]